MGKPWLQCGFGWFLSNRSHKVNLSQIVQFVWLIERIFTNKNKFLLFFTQIFRKKHGLKKITGGLNLLWGIVCFYSVCVPLSLKTFNFDFSLVFNRNSIAFHFDRWLKSILLKKCLKLFSNSMFLINNSNTWLIQSWTWSDSFIRGPHCYSYVMYSLVVHPWNETRMLKQKKN